MIELKRGDRKNVAIQALLDAFQDDPVAAVHAVRDYVADRRSQARREVAPKGPVLLSVKDVTKTYKLGRQRLEVLKGVTLDIYEGEFVAITGASGSGKSTLLQLMGGLDKPTKGDIIFAGKSLAKLPDGKLSAFRRDTIGFVF